MTGSEESPEYRSRKHAQRADLLLILAGAGRYRRRHIGDLFPVSETVAPAPSRRQPHVGFRLFIIQIFDCLRSISLSNFSLSDLTVRHPPARIIHQRKQRELSHVATFHSVLEE